MVEHEHVDIDGETGSDEDIQWPRSYRLVPQEKIDKGTSLPKRWWSHALYRGPGNKLVKILYSKTRQESEENAQQFLDEAIIGFDMEWPWKAHSGSRLQDKVSLIQIACEDKIALFHIGLHIGKTTDDLIPPTLKKLIESPNIAKAGVAVQSCDMARLKRFFGLRPQGAFELSHLHRLVAYGARNPKEVTTKLVKLATLVEDHLGLPLWKGSVRTSDWSKHLSQKQIEYAAADAYAGFMLFHCMNAKRMAMEPVPPLPLLADLYLPFKLPPIVSLHLGPSEDGREYITAIEFFGINEEEPRRHHKPPKSQGKRKSDTTVTEQEGPITKTKKGPSEAKAEGQKETIPLDAVSKTLYDQLSERRKILALKENVAAFRVASNAVLECLARDRPMDETDLLKVKGIGKQTQEKYGAQWLEVIKLFVITRDLQPCLIDNASEPEKPAENLIPDTKQIPDVPVLDSGRRQRKVLLPEIHSSGSSSAAFSSPAHPVPQLHTGLSFELAETKLDTHESNVHDADEENEDSDESSSAFATPLSRPLSQLKRKQPWSRTPAEEPTTFFQESPTFSAEDKVFRNKLAALRMLALAKIQPKPLEPIVTESVLDAIVSMPPRTEEELLRIPGITAFVDACTKADKNLLTNIIKWAPVRY